MKNRMGKEGQKRKDKRKNESEGKYIWKVVYVFFFKR